MLSLRVNGSWLVSQRLAEQLTMTTRWSGDCYELSWTMQTQYGWRDTNLQAGARVEVYDGGFCVWSGVLDAPDWLSGQFVARGYSQTAPNLLAFDSAGNTTSNPRIAVQVAIAQYGWPVISGSTIPDIALVPTVSTTGVNNIGVLLDAAAEQTSQRWGTDSDRRVYFAPAPTAPTWHLTPGLVELGQTNSNYRSDIFVRYLDSADNVYRTAQAQWPDGGATRTRYGTVMELVDLTSQPSIPAAQALSIANNILNGSCAPQPGWTNAVEVQHGDILTVGGEPAPLSLVRAGQVVRLHGLYNDLNYQGVLAYLDVQLGEVKWEIGSQSVSLSPIDAQREDLSSVIEDITAAT